MPSVIKGEKYRCLNNITICSGLLAMYAQMNNIKLEPSFYKDKIYECKSPNTLTNEYGEKVYFKLKDINKYFEQAKIKEDVK